MSERANPYDNAKMESFFRTLKVEEVYMFEYDNFEEAVQGNNALYLKKFITVKGFILHWDI